MARTKQIPQKSSAYNAHKRKTQKKSTRSLTGNKKEKSFKVDAFTGRKLIRGQVYFKVNWAGYDEQTWEPATRLKEDMPDHFDVVKAAFDRNVGSR